MALLGLWGATPKNKRAHVKNLEQKVACLEAKVAGFKDISDRRERYLVAAVAAIILLLGITFVANREPIKKVATRWIPMLSHSNRDIAAAYDAYENKKYKFALRIALPSADLGDPRAQSLMGLMYYNGRGVERDEREAMKWFRSAAEQGDSIAQLYVGLMFAEGKTVPQDYSEAARWYQIAANRGNPEAQYNLGILYATGDGLPQDNVLAHMWFNLAAAQLNSSIARDRATGNRDSVEKKMTTDQVVQAQSLAVQWRPESRRATASRGSAAEM
jgi:hypothetical protein